MGLNEESTRYHLISPVLATKGCDDPWKIRLETPPPVEPTGFKGRRGKPSGRTDYLIYVRHASLPKPWPVGVLESKPEGVQPMAGMQQAKGYAACARHAVHTCWPPTTAVTENSTPAPACTPGRCRWPTFPATPR